MSPATMAEKKLPFLMRTYACPCCGNEAAHRQFRSRTFGPGKTESDNHVLTYIWNDPQFLQVHPPLYFLYFCTNCYYTVPSETYADPSSALYGRAVSRAHQAARESSDKFIDFVGSRIDYDTITFETALWLHMLAIYIQLLPEEEMRDHYMIGRLFLRAAWLYREETTDRESKSAASPKQEHDESTPLEVVESIRAFDAVLHQGHEGRDRIVAALKADEKRRGKRDAAVYNRALETVDKLLEALHSESYRLRSTFNRSYVSTLHADDKSYDLALLDEIKAKWVYAPTEETEGMRSAIEHFEKAIANDARLNDPDRFFKTSSLIIDLELRCNDLDAAFKKARGVVTSVMNDRQNIMNRVAKTENPSHKMELQKLLVAANRSVERATELQYQIVDMVIEREMSRIQAILKENASSTTGQKKVALLSNGFSHGIIHRLEERKMI